METLAVLLGLVSVVMLIIALVTIIWPIARIGIKTRKQALGILVLSFIGFITASAMLPESARKTKENKDLIRVKKEKKERSEKRAQNRVIGEAKRNLEEKSPSRTEKKQKQVSEETASDVKVRKWLSHEYKIVETKDISSANRKRIRLRIYAPTAKTPEARIATAMEAAVLVHRKEKFPQFLTVFVEATQAPIGNVLAKIDFAPDGCGVSGKDCTGEMWTKARASVGVVTQRQIAIINAWRKNEEAFREVVIRKVKGDGYKTLTKKLKPLYDELMRIKDEGDFKKFGFALRGPYGRWIADVKRLRDETNEFELMSNWNVSFGDLLLLGLDYVGSKEQETKATKEKNKLFSLAFSSKKNEAKSHEINVKKLKRFLAERHNMTPEEVEAERNEFFNALLRQKDIALPENLKKKGMLTQEEKEQACRWDMQCLGDKNSFMATRRCKSYIEGLGQYAHKWTDGWLEAKFSHFRWKNKDKGVVTYMGDKIQFQNGFGAWMPHRYWCDYDTLNNVVLNARAVPGRM